MFCVQWYANGYAHRENFNSYKLATAHFHDVVRDGAKSATLSLRGVTELSYRPRD